MFSVSDSENGAQGWASTSTLSQYNDHTVSGRQQDPEPLRSEDKDERGHPSHEDSQSGASRPTPGSHHPCTCNGHNLRTSPKGKLPKKIVFLGISPALATSHQSSTHVHTHHDASHCQSSLATKAVSIHCI